MQRSFQHSAEGSTWTKKNHKYIRKEGNRYIYPSDLKKAAAARAGSANNRLKQKKVLNSQGSVNRQQESKDFKEYQDWENSYYKRQDQKSKLATNSNRYKTSGSRLTEAQKKNREDAANGNGKIYGTISVKGKASPEERKRENYINNQVIGNAVATKYHLNTNQQAAKELSARRSEKSKNELKRKKAMIAQGETNKGSQEYAKINAPVGKKRAKRLAEEKVIRDKQRKASNNQGQGKGQEYAQQQGKQAVGKLQNEKAKRDALGIQTEQEFAVKNAPNKLKKKGYFTMKNGKSVFVPSDEITMKKMSKAEKLVNKLKAKMSKKRK